MRLFRRREAQNGRLGMEALGGAGAADAIRIDAQSEGTTKRLITVGSVPLRPKTLIPAVQCFLSFRIQPVRDGDRPLTHFCTASRRDRNRAHPRLRRRVAPAPAHRLDAQGPCDHASHDDA